MAASDIKKIDFLSINIYDNDEVYRWGDYLVLRHRNGFGRNKRASNYKIELCRLDTPEKLYQWIIHLLGKNWITTDMLSRMVRICEVHFHYDAHGFVEAAL